jgi:hypothetical protein
LVNNDILASQRKQKGDPVVVALSVQLLDFS